MTPTATRIAGIGALVASALLSGCAPAPAPTPTPTPLFASEDEAFAAAEETYRAYNDALNQVELSDPATFEAVFALTSGDFEEADRKTLSELHAAGYSFRGNTTIARFSGIESDPALERVVATVCVDVSNFEVVDRSGLSVVDASRPDMNPLRVTFVGASGELLIDRADRDDDVPCVG